MSPLEVSWLHGKELDISGIFSINFMGPVIFYGIFSCLVFASLKNCGRILQDLSNNMVLNTKLVNIQGRGSLDNRVSISMVPSLTLHFYYGSSTDSLIWTGSFYISTFRSSKRLGCLIFELWPGLAWFHLTWYFPFPRISAIWGPPVLL